VPDAQLGVLGQKPLRDVVVRHSPKLAVAVEQPRDHDDKRPRRYWAAADGLVAQCLPGEERDRG
jgi:hypothetical protein